MIASTCGAGRPVWEDTASPEDLAALDPGPAGLMASPDVLVVGGGIVGLGVAAMCVREGLGSVCLVERDRLVAGTSGRAAGELAPALHDDHPDWWREMAADAARMHRELDAEWGCGLRTLHMAGIRDGDAVRITDQLHVDPLCLAAGFARHAGSVATRVEVIGVDGDTVRTSAGDVTAGVVVWCTGLAPPGIGGQELVKGHLIATEPASVELPDGILGEVFALQLAGGRILAGGTVDEDDDPAVDRELVAWICDELAKLVPGAGGLEVTHAWTCFRPATPDRILHADRLDERTWATYGHFRTGLLMAPAIGRAIAHWIATGLRPSELGGDLRRSG